MSPAERLAGVARDSARPRHTSFFFCSQLLHLEPQRLYYVLVQLVAVPWGFVVQQGRGERAVRAVRAALYDRDAVHEVTVTGVIGEAGIRIIQLVESVVVVTQAALQHRATATRLVALGQHNLHNLELRISEDGVVHGRDGNQMYAWDRHHRNSGLLWWVIARGKCSSSSSSSRW